MLWKEKEKRREKERKEIRKGKKRKEKDAVRRKQFVNKKSLWKLNYMKFSSELEGTLRKISQDQEQKTI